MTSTPKWQDLRIRIAWNRCNRRVWPGGPLLDLSPEQRRKRRNVLLYFWSGQGTRSLPGREVAIKAGVCHWSRPGWSYACRQSPANPLGVNSIHFDFLDDAGRAVPPGELGLPPEELPVADPDLANRVTSHVAELAMHYRVGATVESAIMTGAEVMFRGLLLMLAGAASDQNKTAGGAKAMWPEVVSYIHEHLHAPPSQEQLARQWGYTRSHFSRLFKAQLGVPPHRYLLRAQIARAKELLRETDLPINGVAAMTGFSQSSRFSRCFRQITSVSPSEYREQA